MSISHVRGPYVDKTASDCGCKVLELRLGTFSRSLGVLMGVSVAGVLGGLPDRLFLMG